MIRTDKTKILPLALLATLIFVSGCSSSKYSVFSRGEGKYETHVDAHVNVKCKKSDLLKWSKEIVAQEIEAGNKKKLEIFFYSGGKEAENLIGAYETGKTSQLVTTLE